MIVNKDYYNWYRMDHDKVREHYGDLKGALVYIGTFCVKDRYMPQAVYWSPRPDRSKGHKDYVMFHRDTVLMTMYVSGMDQAEIEPHRYQDGLQCAICEDVIYSIMRHDMRACSCKAIFVDGGKDYLRTSATGHERPVRIDLLNGSAEKIVSGS